MEKNSVIDGQLKKSVLIIPESHSILGKDIYDENIGLDIEFLDLDKTENKFSVTDKDSSHLDYVGNSSRYKNIEDASEVYLPNKIHNLVANRSNNADTLKVNISAYYTDKNPKEVISTISLNAKILGNFEKIEINKTNPSSLSESTNKLVSSINNQETILPPSSTASISSDNTENNTEQTNATVTKEPSKKKSRLWLIIAAAIVGFILLLLAIFAALYFTGALKSLFGGEKAPQAQEQVIEDPQSEPQSEPQESAVDESASDDATDNTATDEDNTSSQQESVAEDNTQTNTQDDEVVVVTKKMPASSSSSTSACSLASSADDLALIKGCLATKPQAEVVKSLVEESFANNRCNVGKRLLSSYGRRDAKFAYLYGQYFDENSSLSTSWEVKDIDKAIYWYEKAVQLGDTTNAKAALDRLK